MQWSRAYEYNTYCEKYPHEYKNRVYWRVNTFRNFLYLLSLYSLYFKRDVIVFERLHFVNNINYDV